jgi:hypothetical protein
MKGHFSYEQRHWLIKTAHSDLPIPAETTRLPNFFTAI